MQWTRDRMYETRGGGIAVYRGQIAGTELHSFGKVVAESVTGTFIDIVATVDGLEPADENNSIVTDDIKPYRGDPNRCWRLGHTYTLRNGRYGIIREHQPDGVVIDVRDSHLAVYLTLAGGRSDNHRGEYDLMEAEFNFNRFCVEGSETVRSVPHSSAQRSAPDIQSARSPRNVPRPHMYSPGEYIAPRDTPSEELPDINPEEASAVLTDIVSHVANIMQSGGVSASDLVDVANTMRQQSQTIIDGHKKANDELLAILTKQQNKTTKRPPQKVYDTADAANPLYPDEVKPLPADDSTIVLEDPQAQNMVFEIGAVWDQIKDKITKEDSILLTRILKNNVFSVQACKDIRAFYEKYKVGAIYWVEKEYLK